MGREAQKPCLPGAKPKLTASAKPQVQNILNYPWFFFCESPSLCLGNEDLTASFHPAFVCLIPFFGARVVFLASFGRVPGRAELPALLIAHHCYCPANNSCNGNAIGEWHTGTSVLELGIAYPRSDIRVSLIV